MRKLTLILAIVIIAISGVVAQTPTQIIARYDQVTGLGDIGNTKYNNLMFDVTVESQGMKIPMKIISSTNDRMRIEMQQMGMQMLVIINGNKGWISAAGQVQPLPAEALKQQTSQGNVFSSMRWSHDKFDMEYLGEQKVGEQTIDNIKMTDKDPNAKLKEVTVGFDKATGFAVSCIGKADGVDVEITFADYKPMANVFMIPTIINNKMGGKNIAKMVIENLTTDCQVNDEMFAEPKK